MSPVEALRTLDRAESENLGKWRLRVAAMGDHFLDYTVVFVPRRRRADGTVGKRWARPVYVIAALPETALVTAAEQAVRLFPEVLG